MGVLGEVFHGHHNVPVVERNVRRGSESESCAAGPDFLDRKMDSSHSDIEQQG
jgi:hypothetical protein